MKHRIESAVSTNVGKVRKNNEDNYYLNGQIRRHVDILEDHVYSESCDRCFLAAVADGMGGEAFGEEASLLAVKGLHSCKIKKVIRTAAKDVRHMNDLVCKMMKKNDGIRIGTTLVSLYIDHGEAVFCNLGDSRGYLYRDGKLTLMTVDHNRATQMVEMGVLTPEEAIHHPSRHELTKHIGIFEEEMVIEPTFSEKMEVEDRDVFLLCSDGLNDMVTDEEICECLEKVPDVEDAANKLVELALDHGGKDNVTVLVSKVGGDDGPVYEEFGENEGNEWFESKWTLFILIFMLVSVVIWYFYK